MLNEYSYDELRDLAESWKLARDASTLPEYLRIRKLELALEDTAGYLYGANHELHVGVVGRCREFAAVYRLALQQEAPDWLDVCNELLKYDRAIVQKLIASYGKVQHYRTSCW